jgi:hypothetical protein
MNFTLLHAEAQDTQPGIAFPDCADCRQGRGGLCYCAPGESLFAVIWRRVCRFFVTDEFNAQMEALDAETDRLRL